MCSFRRLTNHWKNGNMHGTTTQYLAVATGLPYRFAITQKLKGKLPRVRMPLANEIAEDVSAGNQLENDEYFGINCYKKCVRLFRESGHSGLLRELK